MSSPYLSRAERRRARQQRLYETAPTVVEMRRWLVERGSWDRLPASERPEQLQLELGCDGHSGHGRRALGYGDERTSCTNMQQPGR